MVSYYGGTFKLVSRQQAKAKTQLVGFAELQGEQERSEYTWNLMRTQFFCVPTHYACAGGARRPSEP